MKARIGQSCKLLCLKRTKNMQLIIHDNFRYMFDDWADPVVQLKSSIAEPSEVCFKGTCIEATLG